MPLGEAWRLVQVLHRDPSSAIGAAVSGWRYPLSAEALLLADLFDLMHHVHGKGRPKPHPIRPFNAEPERKRYGNVGGRSRQQVLALLSAARAGEAG